MKVLIALLISVYAYAQTANVKSVNFIQEGDISKLIVDFDQDVFAQRVHLKDDKQIILDIKNAKAIKRYLRGIDTSEFKGSTVYISPYKKPGTKSDLRFAIQLRDNVRSLLETKGGRVTLHIENRFGVFSKKKISRAEKDEAVNIDNKVVNIPKSFSTQDILHNLTQSGVKKYIGKKISINVNNMPYTDLLKIIAETSGFNIIIDDGVSALKPLTLNLINIPWDEALDTILSLGSLVAQKHSNILTIKTVEKARQEKIAELENKNRNKIQEPLVTKVFPVSYATSKDLITIIKGYLTPERGRIQEDARTNQIIVTDTVEVMERIKSIIKTLDTQEPQVLIEAKIVEVDEDYQFRAGLANGLRASYDPFSSVANLGDEGGSFSISTAPGADAPGIFSASIDLFKRLTNLDFQLDLMESESKGKIVTSPKIITENNQSAQITSTDSQPFLITQQDATSDVATTTFETATATIDLTVTPKVTNEGAIALDVNITKEGFGTPIVDNGRPPIKSNAIKTKVLVDNGSTVVIGGMYRTRTAEVEAGIPFLKDLPLIGWLFRSAYNPSRTRSELIVFLTPRIINQKEAGLTNRGDGVIQ